DGGEGRTGRRQDRPRHPGRRPDPGARGHRQPARLRLRACGRAAHLAGRILGGLRDLRRARDLQDARPALPRARLHRRAAAADRGDPLDGAARLNAVATPRCGTPSADSTLSSLLGGTRIYQDEAPQGTPHPFLVFTLITAPGEYTFGERVWTDSLWQV